MWSSPQYVDGEHKRRGAMKQQRSKFLTPGYTVDIIVFLLLSPGAGRASGAKQNVSSKQALLAMTSTSAVFIRRGEKCSVALRRHHHICVLLVYFKSRLVILVIRCKLFRRMKWMNTLCDTFPMLSIMNLEIGKAKSMFSGRDRGRTFRACVNSLLDYCTGTAVPQTDVY